MKQNVIVPGLAGIGLICRKWHNQDSWPKLAKQRGPNNTMWCRAWFRVGKLARGKAITAGKWGGQWEV